MSSDAKAALRREMLIKREAAAARDPGAAARLAQWAARLPKSAIVAAYVPMRQEMDPMPLAAALAARGAALALPAICGAAMVFRRYSPGDPLRKAQFGTKEPDGPEVTPDLVLAPLLAFDRTGGRLGYGAGHYDRWLAAQPAATFGVAYAAQEVHALPLEPHDVRLGAILTEAEFIEAGAYGCG